MIAYRKTLGEFYTDIITNQIESEVVNALGINVGESERRSFRRSLPAISNALRNCDLPDDVEIALEYRIPLTARRVDFMIAGSDEKGNDHVVICELKQWEEVEHTNMPDIVKVGHTEKVHPSWQAYTYGSTLSNFNEYVEEGEVSIETCTFLHDYRRDRIGELTNPIYSEGLRKAKPFISDQYEDLSRFISRYIKVRSKKDLLFGIENGRIRPSKMLAESIGNMLNGNSEYELIDEQRIVYSNLLREIKADCAVSEHDKHVIIVRGGAGTGKSVIAIQLLSSLIRDKGLKAFYVAKSSYVKDAYFRKLTKGVPNYMYLRTLFKGSGSFIDSIENEFDVLIVDEAHRLTKRTKKSFMYYGENQIKEIIHASRVSVFFIDETQTIDIKDYGTTYNIRRAAEEEGAVIYMDDRYILRSQFRCNGSDEYIAWLKSILYNKEFIPSGERVDYDIRVVDDLCEMREMIRKRNSESERPSRMLSGDVFDWKSRTDSDAIDINIGDFHAQWNRSKSFATDPRSIDEVGCIHPSQGMEFEYAGVIIGDDLLYRNGNIVTDYTRHPKGAGEFRRPHKQKIELDDLPLIDMLIRNTYKVLLTRGQKGCYLYVMDENLKEYLKNCIDSLKGTAIKDN